MTFTSEFSWNIQNYDNDMLWLEETLNWDGAWNIVTFEFNLFGILFAVSYQNAHYFVDWLVKLSHSDSIFINAIDAEIVACTLYLAWTRDLWSNVLIRDFSLPTKFQSDYQDLVASMTHYAPELALSTSDFVSASVSNASLSVNPAAVFDTYQDSTHSTWSEFGEYFAGFGAFFILVLILCNISRIASLANDASAQIVRVYAYVYSMSTEVRFQFEAAVQVFFFMFLYTSMMLATFDDDQEELSEFFNSMCYYFFLFTLVYYLYKYSIHYFSYLEAAKGDSKATFPLTQFLFDALNTVAFVLRFLVLMIRLNIYDAVDDVLDSFYIFMADFEEEEYFSDTFFSLFSVMSFDTDVHDDRSFLFEDEMDFSADLFTVYFLVWGKFAYFWLFILEEIARVGLALYVTYLVIFEINAVNRSYSEDNFLLIKRSKLIRTESTSSI